MIYMYNIVLTQVCVFSCSFARQVSRDVLEVPEFLCDKPVVIGYKIHTETNRLLQLLCTYPSTINHELTNLRQFCCILKKIKELNDCFM
jgi:hypothetical protein